METNVDEAQDDNVALRYKLSGCGFDVLIAPEPTNTCPLPGHPRWLAIVDRSSSMEGSERYFVQHTLPDFMDAHDIKEMDIGLFSSEYERHRGSAKFFRSSQFPNGGKTLMASCVRDLIKFIESTDMVNFIIITDGICQDGVQVLNLIESFLTNRKNVKSSVSGLLVRKTSLGWGPPDATILSAFGLLTTTPYRMVDIDSFRGFHLSTAVENVEKFTMTAPGEPCLCTIPGDELTSASKSRNCFVAENAILDSVDINGKSYRVSSVPLRTGAELVPLLQRIEQRVRTCQVSGLSGRSACRSQEITTWANHLWNNLDDILLPFVALQSTHKKRLHRLIGSRTRGLLLALKERANTKRVNKMNQQQRADYLREATQSAASRRLAKRMADKGDIVLDAVKSLRKHPWTNQTNQTRDAPVSFVSLASTGEMVESVDENLDCVEESDILLVVGCVGLAIDVDSSEYPDPWQARIKHVYVDCYISQPDVCEARSRGTPLLTPFTKKLITSVVPLREIDPEPYDHLSRYGAGILDTHASVSLRGMIGSVSHDALALKTKCAMKLLGSCVKPDAKRREIECFLMLARDLKHEWRARQLSKTLTFQSLLEAMVKCDPLGLSGRHLSHISKAWLCILLADECVEIEPETLTWLTFWQSLRDFKHTGSVHSSMRIFKTTTVPPSLIPNIDGSVPVKDDDLDVEAIADAILLEPMRKAHELGPLLNCRDLLRTILAADCSLENAVDAFLLAGKESLCEPEALTHATLLRWAATAVCTSNIDEIVSRGREFDPVALAVKLVREEYGCQWSLAHKHHMERHRKSLLDEMPVASVERFIEILRDEVTNQSWEDVGLIVDILLQSQCGQLDTPRCIEKLKIFLSGRHGTDIVWNQGNNYTGDVRQLWQYLSESKLRDVLPSGSARWRYRESNKKNRHGNCNSSPSYWALNYYKLGFNKSKSLC